MTRLIRESVLREADSRPPELRYVDGGDCGIRRVRRGSGFAYVGRDGKRITDTRTLERIRALVIPPAWKDVWICTYADGHLQATGIDARGRKQYRYHEHWTAHRNTSKFATMTAFGRVLPKIRRRVREHLALPGMPREKVLACVVHVLDVAHIRIGNEEYAKSNKSFGLTTMRNKHASVHGDEIRLCFTGKSGKTCDITLKDPKTAAIVRKCQDLPGQELFAYVDPDGTVRDVTSCDVNAYLQEIAGVKITAKDFRTWAGTVIAAETLLKGRRENAAEDASAAALKRAEVAAVKAAAAALNNTVATCRKFYVHPELATFSAGGALNRALEMARSGRGTASGLGTIERAVLALLERGAKLCGEAKVKRKMAA
jgi:DNA topoisomerase-1